MIDRMRWGGVRGVFFSLIATLAVASLVGCGPVADGEPDASAPATAPTTASPSPSPQSPPPPAPVPEPKAFDTSLYSIDDPASIWVVSNKLRPLNPIDYVPADLVAVSSTSSMRTDAAAALPAMFAAAAAEGSGGMQVQNAYRSFVVQTDLHNRLVAQLGQARARAQSARPGYSEHQTGLSLDILSSPAVCSIEACFGETPQGIWLAANAWRFGYLLRYPADKTAITGYIYEPWHFRYIGTELAAEMHVRGVTTLEEFFELPAAPDYAG